MMLDKAPNDRQIQKLPPPFLPSSTPYVSGSDFRAEIKAACISNRLISSGLKISKVIILGNVAVGKSSLVNRYSFAHSHTFTTGFTLSFINVRFCHSLFDQNYKATIGVDFEVERFDILQVPFNLQM